MFGKLHESAYTGSAVGSGPIFFAVWPYIIAKMRPNRARDEFTVELNPVILAAIIGKVTPEDIRAEIEKMCEPDSESRTVAEGGRRLIRVGSFEYQVVNGPKYDRIRSEDERRDSNREAAARFREKRNSKRRPRVADPEQLKRVEKVKDSMIEDRALGLKAENEPLTEP